MQTNLNSNFVSEMVHVENYSDFKILIYFLNLDHSVNRSVSKEVRIVNLLTLICY